MNMNNKFWCPDEKLSERRRDILQQEETRRYINFYSLILKT